MLNAMLRFEMNYHFKQITFRISAMVFFLLGMVAMQGSFGNEVYKNSPYTLANITGLISLCTIFSATLFCANVVLRDTTNKMDAILFTTSVKRLPYFLTRFTGLLMAVFMSLGFATMGMMAGGFFISSSDLGPFHISSFLQPLLVIGFPNVLFCSAVIFAAGLLTANVRIVYAAGVLLYVLYWVGSILGNSPLMATSSLNTDGPGLLSLLADPFGLSIFFSETRSWSIEQKNSVLFPLRDTFLLNRFVWICTAILLLWAAYKAFRFRLKLPASSMKKDKPATGSRMVYRNVATKPGGFRHIWISICSQFKLETISLFKHIPFMVMMILWIFMYAMELKDTLFGGPYSIRYFPATGIILEEFRSIKPALILIIFYAVELVWRERTVNVQVLIYSTPVRNIVPWAAKTAALGVLIAAIITANICIGIGMQLVNGYTDLELPRYLSLYYYSGLPLILFAVLFIFIVTIVSNKYLGMLLSLFAALVILFSSRIGIEHYLLRYASVPDMFYSDMNGFGHYAGAFNWYMLYWSGLAIILSVLTIALWQSGGQLTLRQRLKSAGTIWGKPGKIILLVGVMIWIGAGSWIYYQTNLIGRYEDKLTRRKWAVGYEQKYRWIAFRYQPAITQVKTTVDLFPNEQKYTVKGNYVIKNESDSAVTVLCLGTDPEVSAVHYSVAGAKLAIHDDIFNQYKYELTTPLLPGKSMSINFSLAINRSGFTPFNNEHSVVKNGSYVELEKYLPFLGYNDRHELSDKQQRMRNGLPAIPQTLPSDEAYHFVDYETTISTPVEQQVITVGELQKKWTDGPRAYFHYKTTRPTPFMFAFSSGKYECKNENYNGVELNVYYHPGHTGNLPAMMQGMKDALDYGSANYGAYPHHQLSLVEIPQYRGAATAYPGVLFSAERINFLSDFSDTTKTNQAFAIAAHETAHQWWGTLFEPAYLPGSKFLTESIAKYTEAMVIEKRFGKMYLRNYLQADNRLYSVLRSMEEDEQPLDSVAGQAFVQYQKGSLAMYAIKESIGAERVNIALRSVFAHHTKPGKKAKAAELKEELCREVSTAQQAVINDQLSKIITWSLKIIAMDYQLLPGGKYSVTMDISIVKNNGSFHNPKSIPVNDSLEIAVFDQHPGSWNQHTRPKYLQKHHFSNGRTRLTVVVDQKPVAAAIDPYSYLPDDDLQDNIFILKK